MTTHSSQLHSTVRAAIYARVSSDKQAQEQTIDSQIAALCEQVARDGLSLAEECRFLDEGVSGSTLNRPALERLRDMAYVGGFARLYVHSPDRLARKYAYQVLLVDELQKQGIEIVFLNRAIGVSPEEDLLLQMQGMFAEYERAKIMERSRRGRRHAAVRGRVSVMSGAPYAGGDASVCDLLFADIFVANSFLGIRLQFRPCLAAVFANYGCCLGFSSGLCPIQCGLCLTRIQQKIYIGTFGN
jgi:DNA invertase Pin-like site-specific DNA recombinase